MEFYAPLGKIWAMKDCFNSQRDGILLSTSIISLAKNAFQFPTGWNSTFAIIAECLILIVSIPNGMEFYTSLFSFYRGLFAFQFPTGGNSTIIAYFIHIKQIVSIPNGMEFYLSIRRKIEALALVSIPNGMEFYKEVDIKIADEELGFNSQRDGILQKPCPFYKRA